MTRSYCMSSIAMGLLVMSAIVVLGCESPYGPAPRAVAPPLRADRDEAPPQYTYSHEMRPTMDSPVLMEASRLEYVVAVARVGDTRAVDTPFGDRQTTANVNEVNVTASAAAGQTSTVIVGVDDSLRTESIAPQPPPAGFTQRARIQIISDLLATGCFTVVERESINDIIRELEFGRSRWVATDGQVGEGGLKQVRYIVTGGLEVDSESMLEATRPLSPDEWVGAQGFPEQTAVAAPYLFRLRMYSVRTGVVVAMGEGYGQTPREAISNAVTALSNLVLADQAQKAGVNP